MNVIVGRTHLDAVSARESQIKDSLLRYDEVITNQQEFEKIIGSPNWLNAESVCFIGDLVTNLKFTKSDGEGIRIPIGVKVIQGLNNATIEISNLVDKNDTGDVGFGYLHDDPVDNRYSITDMTVIASGNSYTHAFANCKNLTNCTGIATTGDGAAHGFSRCTQLTKCIGTAHGRCGYGFSECYQLNECVGKGIASGDMSDPRDVLYGYGFTFCFYLMDCVGTGKSCAGDDFSASFHYGNYLDRCSGIDSAIIFESCERVLGKD